MHQSIAAAEALHLARLSRWWQAPPAPMRRAAPCTGCGSNAAAGAVEATPARTVSATAAIKLRRTAGWWRAAAGRAASWRRAAGSSKAELPAASARDPTTSHTDQRFLCTSLFNPQSHAQRSPERAAQWAPAPFCSLSCCWAVSDRSAWRRGCRCRGGLGVCGTPAQTRRGRRLLGCSSAEHAPHLGPINCSQWRMGRRGTATCRLPARRLAPCALPSLPLPWNAPALPCHAGALAAAHAQCTAAPSQPDDEDPEAPWLGACKRCSADGSVCAECWTTYTVNATGQCERW